MSKVGAKLEIPNNSTGSRNFSTHHRVRVTKKDCRTFGWGRSPEELLQESFRFLLEREPNTSILPSFDLPLIGRYFPEYEREIQTRLHRTP